MKIFCRFVCVAIYLVFLTYVLVLPSGNISFKLYKGKRTDTMTEIVLTPLDAKISFKRLPFDNLWLSPLKLFPYINVGFVSKDMDYLKVPYTESIQENTLGYCYLLALYQSDIQLPINSDIVDYVGDEFTLSDLKAIPKDVLTSLLKKLSNEAIVKTVNINKPVVNSIAETVDKKYLFIYAIDKNKSYVLDPEHPWNLNNYIENNKYSIYMNTYDIKSYYKIAGDEN